MKDEVYLVPPKLNRAYVQCGFTMWELFTLFIMLVLGLGGTVTGRSAGRFILIAAAVFVVFQYKPKSVADGEIRPSTSVRLYKLFGLMFSSQVFQTIEKDGDSE